MRRQENILATLDYGLGLWESEGMNEALRREPDGEAKFSAPKLDQQPLPAQVRRYNLPPEVGDEIDRLGLPHGYGLVGGAARDVALRSLTGERLPVRDVDVVAFADFDPDVSGETLREVSTRLMPDDYQYGHGVGVERLDEYFVSRDFTMNEVAVVDGSVFLSVPALEALQSNVVEPTEHARGLMVDGLLDEKLAVKAILMASVLEEHRGSAELRGFDVERSLGDARPFFIALGFQKALEYGLPVTHRFLDKLVEYGAIGQSDIAHHDQRLTGVADWLRSATDFEFRGEAVEALERAGAASIGDWLWTVSAEGMEDYTQYHAMAQNYGGLGRKYTDESRY